MDWAQPAVSTAAGRTRAADHVFEALAGAILRGQLAPDDPLPPERELAARFEISRVLVREAVHKLKELGLVRVRQGGQTMVLDPELTTDVRVTILTFELAAPQGTVIRDMAERQLLQGALLLELAEGRMVTGQIDTLEKIVADYEAVGEEAAPFFMMQFWVQISRATQNKILLRETMFWCALAARRTGGPPAFWWDHEQRLRVHRGIAERLRRRGGAADFYLSEIRPLLAKPRAF